jgi:pimeloyl-ACP methyl ester carboxylesterase
MQATLRYSPDDVYRGTVASCLAYRSHPDSSDANMNDEFTALSDEEFFVNIARKGNPEWLGKLMADHTNLDWRDAIRHNFGPGSGCEVNVMVVASERSGCFPAAGPLFAARLIKEEDENEDDEGPEGENEMRKVARKAHVVAETIDWGGHWCYWENPERFNALVSRFLRDERV